MRSLSRLSAIALTLSLSACSSPLTAPSDQPRPVTFHLVDAAAQPLAGWQVCQEVVCARTDAGGLATLTLTPARAVFITFRGPSATWGDIYTPSGPRIEVVIR